MGQQQAQGHRPSDPRGHHNRPGQRVPPREARQHTFFSIEIPPKYVSVPSEVATQGVANIDLALKMLKDAGVVLPPTKAEGVTNHNAKAILELIWVIILHYLLKRIRELACMPPMDEGASEKTKSEDLKRILRDWLGELRVGTKGFTEEWRDGMCMLSVLYACDASLVPDYGTRSGEDACGNLAAALEAGAKLGVPELFVPNEVAEAPVVDKRSLLTYLTEVYCAVLAGERLKGAKKVDDATKRGKAIRQRIADVEKRLAAITAENDRLRKDVSTLKTQRQNAVADGVAETQDLRNKIIRALENENRSLSGGGAVAQIQQQQQGFRNFQLRNIGKADEEENKRLKSTTKDS